MENIFPQDFINKIFLIYVNRRLRCFKLQLLDLNDLGLGRRTFVTLKMKFVGVSEKLNSRGVARSNKKF
jgi:hypothetical protein